VHAFVFEALGAAGDVPPALVPGVAWARAVLEDGEVEVDSRDERLWRHASDEEVALALEGFWRPGVRADLAQDKLIDRLMACDLDMPAHEPFDERGEEDMHPVLIDAGWELLPLRALDPERHKGAVQAFGEPIAFDVARFEEENAYETPAYLQELPALGPVELLRGADGDGVLVEPLTLWVLGNETYHGYVVRGVVRAAKL
jgi:hypothetical protein